jgi:hypothetical protein
MGPRVLEQKLAQRYNDSRVQDLLHTFSTRCGLRVSLRWDSPLYMNSTAYFTVSGALLCALP